MSWKIIVAGGWLTALEKQIPTAQVLQRKIMQSKVFLDLGEKVKDVCSLRTGDALGAHDVFQPCFHNVTWSGNILHLFTPDEVSAYVKKLYNITKVGGYAFASVHSLAGGEPALVEYFIERKRDNEKFPGFFVTNKIQYYRCDPIKRIDTCTKVERVRPFYPAPKDMSPIKIIEGSYNSCEEVEFDHGYDGSGTYKIRCHSSMHVFDPESLSYFFIKEGFEIQEAFFINTQGKKVTHTPSFEEMMNTKFAVGIIARKVA